MKKIKNVETIGINESDEHDTPPRLVEELKKDEKSDLGAND